MAADGNCSGHGANGPGCFVCPGVDCGQPVAVARISLDSVVCRRSEEHTSELQSRGHLVCRLLLEKKKKTEIHKIAKDISVMIRLSIQLHAIQLMRVTQ